MADMILFRDAILVDGSGAPPARGALLVREGRIECLGANIEAPEPRLGQWKTIVSRIRKPEGEVNIAVVGKYTHLKDSYKSLAEALSHGGIANNMRVNLNWQMRKQFRSQVENNFLMVG